MNKKILTLILLGAIVLPITVFAAVDSIQSLSMAIVNAIWPVFVVIVVICFVVAGILFLSAMGEPEKIAKAKSAFLWGVVGVVVGIVAYSIIRIISNILG